MHLTEMPNFLNFTDQCKLTKTFVNNETTMILSPESEFFSFFGDKKGK